MPPNAALSTEPVIKRVHVGNLAPSVTAKDLVQRFSSFGNVVGGEQGVQGLGNTETGTPRAFAFFSLETTDAKFARCMSMLNGSTWKAHKLRIGPAKPDWQSRLAAEREAAAAKQGDQQATAGRPKKRKRSKDPNVGVAATHFELVDKDNVQRHRGWLLDPKPVPTPLFPIIIRPSRPVGPPPAAPTTAWSRAPTKAKPSKAARAATRLGIAPEQLEKRMATRAKRMRIDPRRWGRQKIVFDVMSGISAGTGMKAIGTWECEEPEEGQAVDKEQVTWVFKTRDGQVRRRETVRLTQRTAHTDRFTTLLERLHESSAAAKSTSTPAPSSLPLSAAVDPNTAETTSAALAESAATTDGPVSATRARSLSPPPYVPIAPRTLIYNEEDEFQLVETGLNDDERAIAHARERAEYRKLALSALAEIQDLEEVELANATEAQSQKEAEAKAFPKVEGYAQDDDDDEEVFEALRLRGGAGGDASESDDSSSSDDSDSDSDSDESSDEGSEAAGVKVETAAAAVAAKPNALKETLTALFKPGSAAATAHTASAEDAGAFSLFSGMDLDIDANAEADEEGVAIPLAPPIDTVPIARPVPSMAPMRGSRYGGPQVSSGLGLGGPSKPFFLFPSGPFEDAERPGEVDDAEVEKLGLPAVSIERAKDESKRRIEEATKDFWRHEPLEVIDENHLKMRETLRGLARKRHREAVKRTRKTGGSGRRGATSIPLDLLDE
ncbi:hypothetical protein JCM10908_003069 [Rhodotorula pacifica]|uniref:NOL8 family RNA-binding protein n=1 Tax=Rhodotorula pacifica TaxID=1495444 RepID=UPI003175E5B6